MANGRHAASTPGPRRFRALTTIVALLLAVGTAAAHASQPDFEVGFTHTNTPIPYGHPDATARAVDILQATGPLQNQHLMGFGTENPWPDPDSDQRDWASLNDRIDLIERTGGTPVLTLCCAPGWMTPSGDDWVYDAPLREHYADYAQLAAEAAERYPNVRHFQVWNEFKGFWDDDGSAGGWLRHADFTDFYNEVYTAVKAVRPDALIGGPYISLHLWYGPGGAPVGSDLSGDWGEADGRDIEAVRYWLDNNVGAEFFTLDAWTIDKDGNALDEAATRQMYADVTAWMAAESGLPVWWSEYYAPPSGTEPGDDVDPTTPAMVTAALEGMRDGGAAVALWWQPECGGGPHPCVFTSTADASGGQRTEFTEVAERFAGR